MRLSSAIASLVTVVLVATFIVHPPTLVWVFIVVIAVLFTAFIWEILRDFFSWLLND